MVDYTTPITTTFEMQRKSIEQGQQALHRTVEMQKQFSGAFADGLESTESAQRRLVELQQETIHQTLDAIEANVPGADTGTEEVREVVDDQFEQLLANHEEAFDVLAEELDEGMTTYDEMTADYLDALGEQVDLVLETHEELETQSVEAVEELGEQVEEMQEQVEEMTEQMQEQVEEVSEQAAEAVEA